MPVPMPASKMPHSCGEAYVPVGMHTYSFMCGIFEADFSSCILIPHVPLMLHMGLLRCSLFEAMPAAVSAKCFILLQSAASVH